MANVYKKDGACWGRVVAVFGLSREVRLSDGDEEEAFQHLTILERYYLKQIAGAEEFMGAVLELEASRGWLSTYGKSLSPEAVSSSTVVAMDVSLARFGLEV